MGLRHEMREEHSEDYARKAKEVPEGAARKLEEIAKK